MQPQVVACRLKPLQTRLPSGDLYHPALYPLNLHQAFNSLLSDLFTLPDKAFVDPGATIGTAALLMNGLNTLTQLLVFNSTPGFTSLEPIVEPATGYLQPTTKVFDA
jgi:hypothetical protein